MEPANGIEPLTCCLQVRARPLSGVALAPTESHIIPAQRPFPAARQHQQALVPGSIPGESSAVPVAKPVATTGATWCLKTLHPDGSLTIVAVASHRRALVLLENARPGETVTIDGVRGSHAGT